MRSERKRRNDRCQWLTPLAQASYGPSAKVEAFDEHCEVQITDPDGAVADVKILIAHNLFAFEATEAALLTVRGLLMPSDFPKLGYAMAARHARERKELREKLAALADEWDDDCEGIRELVADGKVTDERFARGGAAGRKRCAMELRALLEGK